MLFALAAMYVCMYMYVSRGGDGGYLYLVADGGGGGYLYLVAYGLLETLTHT